MAKGLRVSLSATEARALAKVCTADAGLGQVAEQLRRGVDAHHALGANRRAAAAERRAARAAEPTYHHLDVDGHRVTAQQADWYDAGTDPDRAVWRRIHHDKPWRTIPTQTEHRPGWWMVYVWPVGADVVRLDPVGERLVEHLTDAGAAAAAIIAEARP